MRHVDVPVSATVIAGAIAISSIPIVVNGLQDEARKRQARPEAPATRVTTLTENGGRLDWSERLDLIAFDRLDGSYFNIYTMRPDGSDVKCLTCEGQRGMPSKSKGNPARHPSGEYIVFQAQNDYKGLGIDGLHPDRAGRDPRTRARSPVSPGPG